MSMTIFRFDNEWDDHMNSEIHEESGYVFDLDSFPMNGKNQMLVTYEPVGFEKWLVEVQDFDKIIGMNTPF